MKIYETTIDVSAPQAQVLRVLSETRPREPEPFGILKLEGDLRQGARVEPWSELAPDRAFALAVTVFDAPERMVWHGGGDVLWAVHRHAHIHPVAHAGGHPVCHKGVFGGLMAPLLARSLPDLTPSFEKFSLALKERTESQ